MTAIAWNQQLVRARHATQQIPSVRCGCCQPVWAGPIQLRLPCPRLRAEWQGCAHQLHREQCLALQICNLQCSQEIVQDDSRRPTPTRFLVCCSCLLCMLLPFIDAWPIAPLFVALDPKLLAWCAVASVCRCLSALMSQPHCAVLSVPLPRCAAQGRLSCNPTAWQETKCRHRADHGKPRESAGNFAAPRRHCANSGSSR